MDKRRASAVKEIAFVDPGVSDLGTLLGSLREGVRAVMLDRTGDAVRQIAAAVDGIAGLQSIHIVAHGAPGETRFSAGALSLETVLDREKDLARIGDALGTGGELLLWSCETGQGARGDRFVKGPSRGTGAVVAPRRGH